MRAALLSIALGLAAVARAEEAPRPVTLVQALAAAGDTPARRAAAQRTRAAAADVDAAGAWPAVAAGAATTLHTPRAIVTLSLPLPIFGTIGAARAVARAELAATRADEDKAVLEHRKQITTAWIALARAEAEAALGERIAAGEARLAQVARGREAAGDTSRADVIAAAAASARALADATAAHDAALAASAALAVELAWDPALPLHADPGLPDPVALPPAAELAARAGEHPEIKAAGARVAGQAAGVTAARRARLPLVGVEVEASIDDPTLPGNDLRAGLTLEVPLAGGAAVRAARSRQAAAEFDRLAAEQAVRGRLATALRRHAAAATKAASFAREVLPAQREAAELARTAYREGQARLADVLQAERALADAELEALAARAEAAVARAELDEASGS